MLFIFSMPVLVRHLWQLKTIIFLYWCLIRAVLFLSCSILAQRFNLISVYKQHSQHNHKNCKIHQNSIQTFVLRVVKMIILFLVSFCKVPFRITLWYFDSSCSLQKSIDSNCYINQLQIYYILKGPGANVMKLFTAVSYEFL